jgi:hypothetical protein
MYKTANSEYGKNVEQGQAPYTWHGKEGKFTQEFTGAYQNCGLNTDLNKSKVGANPQFGANPYENPSI